MKSYKGLKEYSAEYDALMNTHLEVLLISICLSIMILIMINLLQTVQDTETLKEFFIMILRRLMHHCTF